MVREIYLLRDEHSHQAQTWAEDEDYEADTFVYNPTTGGTYVAKLPHTSTSDTEPGVGADWETYWQPFAIGIQGPRGETGETGIHASRGDWADGTDYVESDWVYHARGGRGKGMYRAKDNHHSVAGSGGNEPEVGSSWTDHWERGPEGGVNGSGSGDVVGPSSAVADEVAGWADVTGKLLKNLGPIGTLVSNALTALSSWSTAPDGAADEILMKVSGVWKRISVNNFAKRKISITLLGGAWEHISCGASSRITLPTTGHYIRALSFAHTDENKAVLHFKLPKGYDGGTIDAYIDWFSTGTTSNSVKFAIAGRSIGDGESLDSAVGSEASVVDSAHGTAYLQLTTGAITGITLAGTPAGGEKCKLVLMRKPADPSDNLDETIYVTEVTLRIGVNRWSEE
jgi:hypothetical protein